MTRYVAFALTYDRFYGIEKSFFLVEKYLIDKKYSLNHESGLEKNIIE